MPDSMELKKLYTNRSIFRQYILTGIVIACIYAVIEYYVKVRSKTSGRSKPLLPKRSSPEARKKRCSYLVWNINRYSPKNQESIFQNFDRMVFSIGETRQFWLVWPLIWNFKQTLLSYISYSQPNCFLEISSLFGKQLPESTLSGTYRPICAS